MPLDPLTINQITNGLLESESKLRWFTTVAKLPLYQESEVKIAIQSLTKARLLLNSEIQKMNSTQATPSQDSVGLARDKYQLAMRKYEEVHSEWMNSSIFNKVKQDEVVVRLATARKEWEQTRDEWHTLLVSSSAEATLPLKKSDGDTVKSSVS